MQLIRCTKKLQKEMGLKKQDLSQNEPKFSYLGPWHANLLHLDRRKCVLFTNNRTLFNFLIPDVPRNKIRELDDLFRGFLECVLSDEVFSDDLKQKILGEYRDIEYANTNSKSVLGSMNDLAYHYQYHVLSSGGVHGCDLPYIIRQLNRMPMASLEYCYPIEELKALYGVPK